MSYQQVIKIYQSHESKLGYPNRARLSFLTKILADFSSTEFELDKYIADKNLTLALIHLPLL